MQVKSAVVSKVYFGDQRAFPFGRMEQRERKEKSIVGKQINNITQVAGQLSDLGPARIQAGRSFQDSC